MWTARGTLHFKQCELCESMGTFSLAALSEFLDADSASSALAATITPRVLGDDSNNDTSGPLAVFYANCQGSGLA